MCIFSNQHHYTHRLWNFMGSKLKKTYQMGKIFESVHLFKRHKFFSKITISRCLELSRN